MNVHTIFVEPANYTNDLIENVYDEAGIRYSFLHSSSIASNDIKLTSKATWLFDQNSFLKNIQFLWNCSTKHDLIIFNGYNHPEFIPLWIFSFFNKSFIGIESDTPYRETKGIKGLIKRMYLGLIFSNKKLLGLAGGNGLHKDLFLKYGMPAKRIFLLPMMVNNAKYYQLYKQDRPPQNKLKFIFVGRLVPEKNLMLMVKAFKAVLQHGKMAELDIIGDGICRNGLEELIAGTTAIKLVGKKFGSALTEVYHNADVLILPSSFEPWGLVVNEALSAGLPVICSSAVGAVNDLVLNPDAGWIFEYTNEKKLIDILNSIIDNPKQIEEKAKRGQEFILNYWNYDLYKQGLKQIFDYGRKN